jgi:tellurite resistance protein TerC
VSGPIVWGGFVAFVVLLVGIDLRVHARQHRRLSVREATGWSIGWVVASVAFGLVLLAWRGTDDAVQFFTAYLLEKTLSVDNLFVFLLLFEALEVPEGEQHRVLTWGILGALVMRAVFILAGIELLRAWHPVTYVLGGFLVVTGLRALVAGEGKRKNVAEGRAVRWARKVVPLAPRYEGGRFLTRVDGRRVGTLLLLVLVVVEASDIMFAVDSIPAVLAVTDDPFLAFSSNILAILGLRALFFVVVQLLERLRYLRYGLGVILAFIGAKMLLGHVVHVSPLWALATTVGILLVTVVASLAPWRRRETK